MKEEKHKGGKKTWTNFRQARARELAASPACRTRLRVELVHLEHHVPQELVPGPVLGVELVLAAREGRHHRPEAIRVLEREVLMLHQVLHAGEEVREIRRGLFVGGRKTRCGTEKKKMSTCRNVGQSNHLPRQDVHVLAGTGRITFRTHRTHCTEKKKISINKPIQQYITSRPEAVSAHGSPAG